MEVLTEIIASLVFLLPAGFSNMAPVFFRNIKILDYPVDFNTQIGNKRLFGENKTWRGFFFGVIFSLIAVYIEFIVYPYVPQLYLFDYTKINIILLGVLLGFGALFGDLIKSFLKRRISKKPGESWAPFDQIDWILGALLFASLYLGISVLGWVVCLIVYGLLHPLVNYLGYVLKIKKNKF